MPLKRESRRAIPALLTAAAHRCRHVLWGMSLALGRRIRPPQPGAFQPYYYTRADRYPWLFRFAAQNVRAEQAVRLLSFGCSRGEEVFSLRRYFPDAWIKGIDINPRNIARGKARADGLRERNVRFENAASTQHEPTGSYDAIFCLAVLCNGDLTTSAARSCAPVLQFADFDSIVTDFARCLKQGGLLFLHTSNFRFCDTGIATGFEVVLEADPSDLAPDVIFDRNNQLMPGERARYRAVAFRKR